MTPAHWEELIRAALEPVVPFDDGAGWSFEFDEREVSEVIERALDRMGFEIVRKEQR